MQLPPDGHTYGITSRLDEAGAGAVIGGWAEHRYVHPEAVD